MVEIFKSTQCGGSRPMYEIFRAANYSLGIFGFINKHRITIRGITNINGNKPYDVDYLPGAAILCKLFLRFCARPTRKVFFVF